MLKNISRVHLIGYWFAAVVIIGAGAIASGVTVAIGTATLLLAMCLVPPAVLLLVWRGAPPSTVGELLHSVNTQTGAR